MGEILSAAQRVYRTFVTDGVQIGARSRPTKTEMVDLFRLVENRMTLNALGIGTAETAADLPEDGPAEDEPRIVFVVADADVANNTAWVWRIEAWDKFDEFHESMATALGPLFDGLRLSLGDISRADDFEFAAVTANEATADGRTVTIPATKTGDNTSLFSFVRPGDEWAGAHLTFVTEFAVNEDFDRNVLPFSFRVRLADGSMDNRSGDAVTVATEVDGFRRISYAYTFDGDETQLEFCARLDAIDPAASEQTITLTRLTASVDSVPDPLTTPTDAALDHRLARQADPLEIAAPWILRYAVPLRPGVHAPEDTVMVSPGGGADFTSIADALTALSTPGTPVKRRAVEVAPGFYEETVEGKPRAFVDIMGRGARDDIKWQFYQDDSTSAADINLYSALSLFWSCRVENLFIDVLNARYGVHPESGGSSFDAFWEFRGCRIRHSGNPSPNYDREGSHPIGVLDAIGSGISAGGYLLIEDCILESATGRGIAVHNWPGQASPSLLVVQRCVIKPGAPVEIPASPGTFYPGGNVDVRIASLMSGQGDRAIFEGNVFGRGMIEVAQDVGPAGAYPISMLPAGATARRYMPSATRPAIHA